jgi:hypothetical protein
MLEEETISLLGELSSAEKTSESGWGIQYLPTNSPLGPTGYVVHAGEVYVWGNSLGAALSELLSRIEKKPDKVA